MSDSIGFESQIRSGKPPSVTDQHRAVKPATLDQSFLGGKCPAKVSRIKALPVKVPIGDGQIRPHRPARAVLCRPISVADLHRPYRRVTIFFELVNHLTYQEVT